MPCSAYTLSLATIAAVISVALIAIAFSTDNWSRITIDRLKLEVKMFNKKKKDVFVLPHHFCGYFLVRFFDFNVLTPLWRHMA